MEKSKYFSLVIKFHCHSISVMTQSTVLFNSLCTNYFNYGTMTFCHLQVILTPYSSDEWKTSSRRNINIFQQQKLFENKAVNQWLNFDSMMNVSCLWSSVPHLSWSYCVLHERETCLLQSITEQAAYAATSSNLSLSACVRTLQTLLLKERKQR